MALNKWLDSGKCMLGFHTGDWKREDPQQCVLAQTCERCGNRVERTEHDWSEWTYDRSGSCDSRRVCPRCTNAETRVEHQWSDWSYRQENACDQGIVCARCGVAPDQRRVQHEWGDWAYDERLRAPLRNCRRCAGAMTPFPEQIVTVELRTQEDDAMQTGMTILLELMRLQRANMQAMLEFDKLVRTNQLLQASEAGAALCTSLDQQSALCATVNRANPDPKQAQRPPDGIWLDVMLRRADVAESLGHVEEGEALRKAALARAAELGGELYAERQRQVVGWLMQKGRFHEALTTLESAREVFERMGEHLALAACHANLADAYEWLGDDDRALSEADAAMAAAGTANTDQGDGAVGHIDELFALADQADNSLDPNALSQALATALALNDRIKHDAIRCQAWQLQARCLARKREFGPARALFEKAKQLLPPDAHPALDFHLIKMQVEAGQYEAAIQAVDALLPVFQSGALRQKLATVLELKARALLESGKGADALLVVGSAHAALAGFDDPDMVWKVWAREAQAMAAIGEPAGVYGSALASNNKAAEIIDWLRRAPLGTRLDSLNLKDKLPVFERGMNWAVLDRDAKACCRYIEMIKARQLSAVMSVPGGTGVANDLSRQVDAITQKLSAIGYGGGEVHQLESLVEERKRLVEQQRIEDPRWRQLTEAPPVDVDRYLRELDTTKQAAITLHLGADRCTAVLLFNGQARAAVRLLDPGLLALLSERGESEAPPEADWETDRLLDLATWVPLDLVSAAIAAESLVLAPHAGLHMLPWALMRYQGKPLFQYLPVTQLPNLSILMSASSEAPPALTAVGASPSTSARLEADQECEDIAALYAATGLSVDAKLLGAQSTRQAFLSIIHGPKRPSGVLHVACHGQFDLSDPMSSHLRLEQGRVDAVDIASGALAFEEVILSACSAGQRPQTSDGVPLVGDEIMGLAGAFLEAGARQLVVSLSPTRDYAASEFMLEYHRGRTEGEVPRHAFRKAQMALWDDGIHLPQDWGGFVLLGR